MDSLQLQGVSSCDDSCYGKNPSLRGATNFRCNGSETKLSECDFDKIKWWKLSLWRCRNYAGVACSMSQGSVTPIHSVHPLVIGVKNIDHPFCLLTLEKQSLTMTFILLYHGHTP